MSSNLQKAIDELASLGYDRDDAIDEIARAIENRVRQLKAQTLEEPLVTAQELDRQWAYREERLNAKILNLESAIRKLTEAADRAARIGRSAL